ncbi:HAD-IIIC family phosphatase [Agrobacterium rosae]|uniref:HAD-IIIC family phosphatase n=1 Tax=Agrobacterium rosae TaxID=1972867 RepID=UPI003BA28447
MTVAAFNEFYAPFTLSVTKNELKRAVIIGSCFAQGISHHSHRLMPGLVCDHVTYNFLSNSVSLPHPVIEYDFQIVMLPLRTVMPEGMFMGLAWDDVDGFEQCFSHSLNILEKMLDGALVHNSASGITSFVADFLVPQANSMGRLLPRNDLRNPVEYVRRLNRFIYDYVTKRVNVFVLGVDDIAAAFGKHYVQDDVLCANSHGAFISDWDWSHDQKRLHPPRKFSETVDTKVDDFILSLWGEMMAMLRTISQKDSVKIVICDIDDTLWRGVLAEQNSFGSEVLEGWPLGLIEALNNLKRRGVLLALASKNDEATIRDLWAKTIGRRLSLDSFASVKINWRPKSENIGEILRETSLLARNALFIDDNPVERETALQAHPGIRVLGEDLYSIRRTLLWSPETQVTMITKESSNRTEMIKSQIERDQVRTSMPRDQFLKTLGVSVQTITIADIVDVNFERAFELVNKTNQFNTTGQRWSREQVSAFFNAGGSIEAFSAVDRFTDYGIVGAALIVENELKQFAMSCRVLGLDVEVYFLNKLAKRLGLTGGLISRIIKTDANSLCLDLFDRCGWSVKNDIWVSSADLGLPNHVNQEVAEVTS